MLDLICFMWTYLFAVTEPCSAAGEQFEEARVGGSATQ